MDQTEIDSLVTRLTERWIRHCAERGIGSARPPTVQEQMMIALFVASLGSVPASASNRGSGGSSAHAQHGLAQTILHLDKQMDMYERSDLLDMALEEIPLQELHSAAEASVQANEVPGYEDGLANALVKWFKDNYFKWIDPVKCPRCGGKTVLREMGAPTAEETQGGAGRVEVHACAEGVWNLEDHVWDEYFSPTLGRWIHLDPCEKVRDEPLLYDKGWGKKMSYVLAFAIDGAKDVTRGYVQDWNATLLRRTRGSEEALRQVLEDVTKRRRLGLPPSDTKRLEIEDQAEAKWLSESEDRAKVPQAIDGQGRESGTADWKHERGEDGTK
ncbi:Peptide-N(4)-(N-acetyl-beta- glucosaminyl)asparagine amidase [Tulasnella sp. 424]|nr:Peptide-N(4)-(N-acetyl-beta- glucosaminyl)asparagine amidase [Tulasnella sp. 424]KAG8962246.1 Peptide-N(4)-(N-acetyl-beta- glucosaminyl)asparagine amidase [Tulasnella sp. 425]